MSTPDVPGSNPANRDVLSMGCWAEHDDGSLILIESTENNRIIYSIFDMAKDPIIEYRDAMPDVSFKSTYSWKPGKPKQDKWTWHDKTAFPWDRVIKTGFSDGQRFASAAGLQTAAERVAESLRLRGQKFDADQHQHKAPTQVPITANVIMDKLGRAFQELLK